MKEWQERFDLAAQSDLYEKQHGAIEFVRFMPHSLNGKIDVTLPASLKANLNLQSSRGEVYSDFDVVLAATPPKVEETKREEGRGRYRVSTGRGVVGKVNGGGQDITFKNMNGDIYIRKGK